MVQAQRVIHLPRPALNALSKLCDISPLNDRVQFTRVILTSLENSSKHAPKRKTYVLQRVLSGLSVSGRQSRLNFSILLAALARHEVLPASEIVSAAAEHYLSENYDHDSISSPRERVLGALAAATALVGAIGKKMSPAAACDIIRLLRLSADEKSQQWHIACPAACVAAKLLSVSQKPTRTALAKPLKEWLKERVAKADGLVLVEAMVNSKILKPADVSKIYKDVKVVSKAIFDPVADSFSLLSVPFNSEEPKDVIPSSTIAALRLALSPAMQGFFPITQESIYRDIVAPLNTSSQEKRLVKFQLVSRLLSLMDDSTTFDAVFHEDFSESIRSAVINYTTQSKKNSETLLKKYTSWSADELVSTIFKKKKLRKVIVNWAVRIDILRPLVHLKSDTIDRISGLDEEEVTSLCLAVVSRLATMSTSNDSDTKLSDEENLKNIATRQRSLVSLVVKLGQFHSTAMREAMVAFMFYSMFSKDEECSQTRFKTPPITMKVLKFSGLDSAQQPAFLGNLPALHAPLNMLTAGHVFEKALMFTGPAKIGSDELLRNCLTSIANVLGSEHSGVRLRCVASDDVASLERLTTFLKGTVLPVVASLQKIISRKGKSTPEHISIAQSLSVVATVVGCFAFHPAPSDGIMPANQVNAVAHAETERAISDCEGIFKRIITCRDDMQKQSAGGAAVKKRSEEGDGGDHDMGSSDEDQEEGGSKEPDPIEQVTHLIADLCGRKRLGPFIAHAGVPLRECADDRVVSVLFDALDTYQSGVKRLVDSESEDGEEDMEDENGDENVDGSDEDDGEDGDDGDSSQSGIEENADDGSDDDNKSNEIDVDVDPDDEDPEVLAKLDKMLGAHVNLVRAQKKQRSKKSIEEAERNRRVKSVIGVIGQIAKGLRLRLQRKNADASKSFRLTLVSLDLLVRLYEFLFEGGTLKTHLAVDVPLLVHKQLIMSTKDLQVRAVDRSAINEMFGRLLTSMLNCKCDQNALTNHMHMWQSALSRSMYMLHTMSNETAPEGSGGLKYEKELTEVVRAVVRPNMKHVTVDVALCVLRMASMEQRLNCLETVLNVVDDKDALLSPVLRRDGIKLIKLLTSHAVLAAKSGSEHDKMVAVFGKKLEAFVITSCGSRKVIKSWSWDELTTLTSAVTALAPLEVYGDYGVLCKLLLECAEKFMPRPSARVLRKIEASFKVEEKSPEKRGRDEVMEDVEGAKGDGKRAAGGESAKKKRRKSR